MLRPDLFPDKQTLVDKLMCRENDLAFLIGMMRGLLIRYESIDSEDVMEPSLKYIDAEINRLFYKKEPEPNAK